MFPRTLFASLFSVALLPLRAEPFVAPDNAAEARGATAWTSAEPYDGLKVPSLRLGPDGGLKALVLADIQIGFSPSRDAETLRMIEALVVKTRPDLVLTAGDNSCFLFSPLAAGRLVETLESLGLPWGVTLGNHDAEGPMDRAWYGRLYSAGKRSLFSSGPAGMHGVGNWSLDVKDEGGRTVFSFIMLDSNEYRRYPGARRGYDFIYPDQIAWYEWLVRGVALERFGAYDPERGQVVPSLLLFHIPLAQFTDAVDAMRAGKLATGTFSGVARERPNPPRVDTGLFEAVKRLGSSGEIIVGHDHRNNCSINWEGIRLTFATKTGPTSYHDDDLLGGTLVTVRPEGEGYAATSEAVLVPRE